MRENESDRQKDADRPIDGISVVSSCQFRPVITGLLILLVFTFMETSCTRFLTSGLSKGTLSTGVPSTTSFPNMVPFSRIFLVRRRVSMPADHQHHRVKSV